MSSAARRRGWVRLGAIVLLAALSGGISFLTRDHERSFRASHGTLRASTSQASTLRGALLREDVRLVSSSGLEVDLAVRAVVAEGARPRPLVLLLGGHRTGRDAVDLVPDIEGVVLASISYPFAGDPRAKGLAFLPEVWAARRALLDTPPALLLALDYLLELPYVDRERVELVGVSLGSPLACVAGALDERVTRVWSIHGGARTRSIFDHLLVERIAFAPARSAAAWTAALLVAPLAPERFAGRIAPRPFVLVSAQSDERIPRASAQALYDAAREPKEQVWLDGGHVEPSRADVVAGLVELVLERVRDPRSP